MLERFLGIDVYVSLSTKSLVIIIPPQESCCFFCSFGQKFKMKFKCNHHRISSCKFNARFVMVFDLLIIK